VQRLLTERAKHYREKSEKYRKTWEALSASIGTLEEEEVPKFSSSRDPRDDAKAGMERNEGKAQESEFLAKWIDTSAIFLLDKDDLYRLGVVESRY
jgi:hypothetical protein